MVNTATLGKITANELAATFADPGVNAEWLAVESELAGACPIEDGSTGAVNPGDRRALWHLVRRFGFASALEIGTHVGASTVYLAAALRVNARRHSGLQPRLVTVDLREVNSPTDGYWKACGLSASPRDMLAAIGCAGFVRFVAASSLAYLDSCDERFDLVFLDGDHHADTVYRELTKAFAVLNRDGVVLLHDYFPGNLPLWTGASPIPGPYLATTRIVEEGAAITVLPLGDLPWPTKLGSRRTSLALLSAAEAPADRGRP